MKTLKHICLLTLILVATTVFGQSELEFNGQLSGFGNYSPDSELDVLVGGRYISELNYGIMLDSTKALDFEVSINIYGSVLFQPFDSAYWDGGIQPYRIWARYTGKRYEVRLGLQKIDFGSATLLRVLQWFNQIDPRDPLQLTNDVYGAVGLITNAKQAEEIIAKGQADIILIARASLRDPHFALHAAHELGADIEWPVQYLGQRNNYSYFSVSTGFAREVIYALEAVIIIAKTKAINPPAINPNQSIPVW